MKFDLKRPCKDCPFRTDINFYLRTDRVKEICHSITVDDATFACHKTTQHDDEGDLQVTKKSQHCAGALIMLEKIDRPNQMTRIMERLGGYDRREMAMKAPVFDSPSHMIETYEKRNCK